MKKILLRGLIFMLCHSTAFLQGLDKLDEKYLVVFGDYQAENKVIQYFSFTCPHCLSLFKKDFKEIRDKYLSRKEMSWTFHPVPMDSLTVQAMDCLGKLSNRNKVIFLEALLDTIEIQDDPNVVVFLMQEAMKTFKQPIDDLNDEDYITNTKAFEDAFNFIKQEDVVHAVPAVEINGKLFRKEIPDKAFINKQMDLALAREEKHDK